MKEKIQELMSILNTPILNQVIYLIPEQSYKVPKTFSEAKNALEEIESKLLLREGNENTLYEHLKCSVFKMIELAKETRAKNERKADMTFALKKAMKHDVFLQFAIEQYCSIVNITYIELHRKLHAL